MNRQVQIRADQQDRGEGTQTEESGRAHANDGFEVAWDVFGPRHVPYRILLLGKMLDRLTTQHVRELAGLPLADWRIMAHLAVMGEKSASEVMSAALMDRAEVSRSVASIVANGLLAKRTNPRNRKSSLLALTDKGRAVYDKVYGERRIFFDEMTADLSDMDLSILDEMLRRIARRADRLSRKGLAAWKESRGRPDVREALP